jgi:restriction system protein
MAFWGVRAGRDGEREDYALDHNIVVAGWHELPDLTAIQSREDLKALVQETYPTAKPGTISNWTGQLWAFHSRIGKDDIVALPLKTRSAIALGKIVGRYEYVENAPPGAQHSRAVKWFRTDIPRSIFDQDILYSLGSAMTIFQVSRNNAEARIRQLVDSGFAKKIDNDGKEGEVSPVDSPDLYIEVERVSADRIANFIGEKFREHNLTRLVAGILVSQGYKVYQSPPGPDGGADILAGKGPLGFDPPRLAVQVKSGASPVDVKVMRELLGVMPAFGADQGLLVSWGGFKESVRKEARQKWFNLRLWAADDIVAALQDNYQQLPEELQAELPFKRIWTLVDTEEELPN